MAVTVDDANAYIAANCIDIDEWIGADEAKKQRIVTVAARDLARYYSKYTIPDAAVYEFANVLATVYGDVAGAMQKGVVSQSIGGKISVSYKDALVTGPGGDTRKFIPQAALDIIGAENGVTLSKRAPKWTVM
ncbi:hypothetical protein DCC85_14290 [Paenibacillus sp. CAA11]|uniref:hypothetical protein n=1 Tax=Paenibacillus sp. CAA11 TaxID=1532905 RepID=UPI000D36845B|nr:hypothetical protein [Paenibacillus sp. CAA11]AWB45279.1 hypothetical protein DCC85_14290 [Paenibacillus sp. CAA11]